MGDRVLGCFFVWCSFFVFLFFTCMKLTSQTPSPPKPAITQHSLSKPPPSLTLGSSSWKRIERPPKYMQIAHMTDQGGEGGLEDPALSD